MITVYSVSLQALPFSAVSPATIKQFNVQSLTDKSFLIHDYILDKGLNFMCLTETWHILGDYPVLIEVYTPGYSYIVTVGDMNIPVDILSCHFAVELLSLIECLGLNIMFMSLLMPGDTHLTWSSLTPPSSIIYRSMIWMCPIRSQC